jgi:hypothetical protein
MKEFRILMANLIDWLMHGGTRPQHQYEILFGKAAAGHGEHGQVVGTWVKEGANNPINITFFFKGFTVPPKMDLHLMQELYHHAAMAGIVVSHVYSYNGLSKGRTQL